MMLKWFLSIAYFTLTFIIPSLGVPSDIYFLFEYSHIFFFVLLIILFRSTLIQELKKINLKKFFLISIVTLSLLLIINLINTPFSKSLSPNDLKSSLSFFFIGATTYGVILEELIFRFCMINLLAQQKTQYVLILISSFLFFIVHGGGIVIFLAGIFLGFIYVKTKNIWYSIGAHALNNWFAIVLYFFCY